MKPQGVVLPSKSILAGRMLGLVVLLTLAAGSGAAIGIANAQEPQLHVAAAQNAPGPARTAGPIETDLQVSEAPVQAPAAAGGRAAQRARTGGKGVPAPVLNLIDPGAGSGSPAANTVKCSRFDDAKIHWLLEQVAKTKAENPEMAAGADKLTAALREALGRNMCASEAQALVSRMCDDPAVVRVMNQMVSQLPFFIKPMVGDPCSTDLVAVLNKVGRFVPGLSSEPT